MAPDKVTLDLPDAWWAVSINGSFTEIVIFFVLFCLLIYSRFSSVGCIQSPLKMLEYYLKK